MGRGNGSEENCSVPLTKYYLRDLIDSEMDGACSMYGERRGAYRILVGKPEGNRPLGIPRCRWEDNIKMDLQEVGCGGMDWIDVAQDRDRWWAFVYGVMNLQVLLNVGNFLIS